MSIKAADIHPFCTSECTHKQVPDLGGIIVQRAADEDRIKAEARLVEWWKTYPRADGLTDRIDYLGILGEGDGLAHTWRCGGKKWKPLPATQRAEGKQAKREINCEYRPGVWLGSGEPVGPVNFSRVAKPEKQSYPEPTLTSDMPTDRTPTPTAAGLLMLASSRGWQGRITFACGFLPHSIHGTPGSAVKASEALRLWRGDQRAVAVRMGDKWASLWTWSPAQFFTRHATLDDFREALR